MLEKNDWRLLNQQEYLIKAKLKKAEYIKPSEKWDHDHCAFVGINSVKTKRI